jgi:hypothetical protein
LRKGNQKELLKVGQMREREFQQQMKREDEEAILVEMEGDDSDKEEGDA